MIGRLQDSDKQFRPRFGRQKKNFLAMKMALTRSKLAWVSVTTLGVSQAVNLGSALVRVPVSISYLGGLRYGIMVTLLAIVPWIATVTGGSRIATRAILGVQGFGEQRSRLRVLIAAAAKVGLSVGVILGLLFLTIYLSSSARAMIPLNGTEFVEVGLVLMAYGTCTPILGLGTGYLDTLGRHNQNVVALVIANLAAIPATYAVVGAHGQLWQLLLIGSLTNWAPGIAALPTLISHQRRSSATDHVRGFATSVWRGSGQGIGNLLSSGFDVLLVSILRGFSAAGEYSLTSRLVLPVLLPSTALAPMQFRRLAVNFGGGESDQEFRKHLQRVVVMNTTLAAIFGLGLFFVYKPLFLLLSPSVYRPNQLLAATCIAASVLGTAFSSYFHGFGLPLALKFSGKVAVAAGALNLGLSWIATAYFGEFGPAFGSCVSYVLAIGFWIAFIRSQRFTELRLACQQYGVGPQGKSRVTGKR